MKIQQVVCYCRYSSDKQSDSSTIETQLEAIYKYCDEKKFKIIKEYIDRGISASEADTRPQFQKMIYELTQNKAQAIVVYTRDRFSRNINDFVYYLNFMESLNCELLCVVGNQENDTASGKLADWVNMIIADYYLKNLSREVIRGMRWNANHCKCNGSPPFGYDIDPATKKYIINEQEAKIIRFAFSLLLKGYSLVEIAKKIYELGYRKKDGSIIQKYRKRYFLNRKYIGEYSYHITANGLNENIVIPNGVPRIIDDESYRKAEEIFSKRERTEKQKNFSLLKGLVRCGYSDDIYVENIQTDSDFKSWYVPGTKYIKKKLAKRMYGKHLNDFTIIVIEEVLLGDENKKDVFAFIKNSLNDISTSLRKKKNDLKEKYNKYINMYSSILKTFLFDDNISQENLMLVVEYKNKKQQAEIELNELNKLIEELPNVSYKSVLHSILMYKKSLEKQSTEIKKIIKLFINKIYLFDEWVRYEINFGPLLSETISKSEIQIIGQFDITRLEIKLFLEQDLNYKIEFKNLNIKKKEE